MFDDPRWNDDPRDRGEHDHEFDRQEAPSPGRGPGSAAARDADVEEHSRSRVHDSRDLDRDRDSRDRDDGLDARDVFMRDVDLPRGPERELVHDARDREYTLRGSETRTLSTVGAFRVVSVRDLRDHSDRPADPRSGDLRHLREQGLIRTERLDGHRDHVVVLTDRGRGLLNAHRHDRHHEHHQEFYAGLVKPREVEHDSQVYGAYLCAAERLAERDARIDRVVLDYELKREYQRWLHEHAGDRCDYDGHPDRDEQEIAHWALEHDLPYFDEQVHFPDLRIEYEEIDGRRDHEDVEVTTIHYRGAHGVAAARSGFSCYGGASARISGHGGGGSRGGGRTGGLAEEFWD
jgi:hypothetical protein